MRGLQVSKFGDSSVLEYSSDVPAPKLKEDEVLVQVKAVGVNPVDVYIRSGIFPIKPPFPFIPGFDLAGIVVELGSKELESKFTVGQRVFASGTSSGAYAELSTVPSKNCYPLSDKLSFSQAAALGIPYLTAYRALLKAKPQPGQTILVHGASGAVGVAVVQLAASKGLNVFGTAGTVEGMRMVKEQGAVKVFNHREKGYTQEIMTSTDGKGVDIVFEMLANVNLNADCEMVTMRGKVIIIGNRGTIDFDPNEVLMKEVTIHGIALLTSPEDEALEQFKGLCNAVENGDVNPVIGKEFSLKDAGAAQDYVMVNGGSAGKVVLTVE